MNIHLHQNDLPADLKFSGSIAVDSETLGLKPQRDRLCLLQLSAGDGDAHLVQFKKDCYDAPHLKKVLADKNITKIFHFARFDVALIEQYLGVVTTPIYCTKIASKLTRTFTQYHGLKNLCRDLISVELDKQQQTTDWGADTLSEEQLKYAASDVLYLHQLKDVLDGMLARENRTDMARACFEFLPTRARLDLKGWEDTDIFAH